jgi:hypothetical protein
MAQQSSAVEWQARLEVDGLGLCQDQGIVSAVAVEEGSLECGQYDKL